MKLTVARGELVESLTTVSRGLSSRSTLPILSGILVSATQAGEVTLEATDLEISVRNSLSLASVERQGSVVVPGRLFSDIIKSLPEAAVTLSVEDGVAAVSCLHASFTVKTLSAEDFPRFPQVDADKEITLPAENVADLVRHVGRAVSRDETRPVLTGILVTLEGTTFKMVATDSYRLAVKETHLEAAADQTVEMVVPGKVMEEIAKMAPLKEDVLVGLAENQAVFSFSNTQIVTRRMEGSFPNYRQLIPKDTETRVEVNREELHAAVKRVSLLAQHNTPLRITVSADDQTLGLSATTHDVGDASEDLMVKVEGPDVEIAFNHSFLVDGLSVAQGETVELGIVSPLKPGTIRSAEDEGFLYLLMPVRLG